MNVREGGGITNVKRKYSKLISTLEAFLLYQLHINNNDINGFDDKFQKYISHKESYIIQSLTQPLA